MLQCVLIHNLVSKSHAFNACTLLVLSRVANFTRPSVYQNAGPMHHCLSVESTSTIFCTYTISPLVPEPKMMPCSRKTKRPRHIKASTRTQSLSCLLRRGPARRSTPTNPTAAHIIFFKRTREKPICSGGAFKKKDL